MDLFQNNNCVKQKRVAPILHIVEVCSLLNLDIDLGSVGKLRHTNPVMTFACPLVGPVANNDCHKPERDWFIVCTTPDLEELGVKEVSA